MRLFLYGLLFFFCGTISVYAQEAEPQWTFVKVKLKGSLLAKERFLQYYHFEPGDIFDEDKHTHSLKKIEKELVSEGYLHARVTDSRSYDKKTKTVSITLTLTPGSRYTIADAQVVLTGATDEDRVTLIDEVQKIIEHDLLRKYASKEIIDKEAHKIRTILIKAGYIRPRLSLTTQRDDKKSTVSLVYTAELPAKKLFSFEGNQYFSTEKLLEEVLALEHEGISLVPSLIAEDIEALYKKKGFFAIRVTWAEKAGNIFYTVKEGPRTHITAMQGDAGLSIKSSVRLEEEGPRVQQLDMAVDKSIKKMVSDLSALGFYDEETITEILNAASADLVDLGYSDVFIDKSLTNDGMRTPHRMLIEIVLGQRRMIQNILIEGYPELIYEEPFKQFVDLQGAQPLSRKVINDQKKWLIQYFKQRGFLYTSAESVFHQTDTGSLLVWIIDTHEGPVRFGPTTVAGLQRMRPSVVLRERAFKEGDVWSREHIEETIKRLKALNMFESVSITPVGGDQQVQPLLIKLVEDDPFEIRTRLGIQFVSKSFTHLSWTTYKVGGSFIWKNPAGMADRLWADIDFTRYSRNLAANYEIPWIGNWPVRTLFRVYSNRFDQPFISSDNHRLYKEAHDGASITFHHNHPWWHGCVKVGFELNKLSGISQDAARVIQFEPALVDVRTPYFYVEPSITFERFDDKVDPTKGFLTNFSFRAMIPAGVKDGWFIRAVLEQSFFYPLLRNVVGALHWRVGHIFNAKFSTILPTERFYLGGACSLRGYETNMVPPLNDLRCDGTCFWVPVGGKSMANVNAEIRFPLYKRLSGVIFTDLGILTQDRFVDIAANRWFGASGFGLRFATPVGPIRFDIGWKWKKRDPKDKSYAWFLTLGHAF